MSKVFVHGNPECAVVWDPLVDALADRGVTDVVRCSPPGFGAPVPSGFEPTMDGYRDWLVAELEAIDGPIDLVGHDWGAGHVGGVAAARPDLIRSFTVDVAGLFHPDYVWHDMAQAWQTPEVGEEVIAGLTGAPRDQRLAMYESFGMTGSIAAAHADAADAVMGECILGLYRSAVQPAMAELGARLRTAERRPSLIVIAEDDGYVAGNLAAETAADLGSEVVRLPGQGHWWMVTGPEPAADAMATFWAGLEG